MAGLKAALGYRLCVLAYGLVDNSPEARIIARNFGYICDELGRDGMLVSGGYDHEYKDDVTGFLRAATETLYSVRPPDETAALQLPKPALVVLRETEGEKPEMGYFSIRGMNEEAIIGTFRAIMEAPDQPGSIEGLAGNLLKNSTNLSTEFWSALQLKPAIFGVGIDLKRMIEKAYVHLWDRRQR